MPDEPKTTRRRRANGEESRTRILDATTEVASERGYEGTSIALVSSRCGLPASSIYWHFTDKDDLIAAVIERSFGRWLAAWESPVAQALSTKEHDRFLALTTRALNAMLESPDFLRLGLMLTLERRPVEPRARAMFLGVRAQALAHVAGAISDFAPSMSDVEVQRLSTYALAGADGLFMAREIDPAVDIGALFALHARVLSDAVARMS